MKEHKMTILGEPASKANSRKLVFFGKKPAFIKSEKARNYLKNFDEQCEAISELFEGNVGVEMTIFYASRRPDLEKNHKLGARQGKPKIRDKSLRD